MKIKLYCKDCGLDIKDIITEEGCPKCNSMKIEKKEYTTDREWLDWWWKKGKKDADKWWRG